jgi:hypothetical protein
MLAEMDRRQRGERDEMFDDQTFTPPKLKGLGISRFQSYYWQLETKVPEKVFEVTFIYPPALPCLAKTGMYNGKLLFRLYPKHLV